MHPNNLKLVIAMARAYNALFSKIEKYLLTQGLTLSEFGVLEMLLHKGDQPVQKVAEKILVTSGTITYVIDKLQQNHLVARKQCEKDKRVFYVSLTPKGKELISIIFHKHQSFLDELLAGTTEESKTELIDKLKLLQDSIK